MLREELLKLRDGVLHLRAVLVVDHDGQRELAEVLALHAQRSECAAQFRNSGLLGIVHQLIARAGVLPVLEIGDKTGLGVMVMPAARSDFFASFRVIDWVPLRDDVEVGLHIEEAM